MTISFCLPITDRHAECVGVIAVDLPVTLLSQIVHANKPSPNSYSVLLSHNGSYIVHHDDDKLEDVKNALDWTEKNAGAGAHEAAEAMLSGATGFKSFQMNDEDWCVFYKSFRHESSIGQPIDRLKWSAGVVYLKDDVLGSYNNLIYLELAIAALCVLVFFLLCRMLIRRQLRPLHMLTHSAQRIAEGHYDETVPRAQTTDEIGQLQDVFRRMQQSLSTKSSELEQLTSMLKRRGEELRKAYDGVQGSDRMKTSFLHNMSNQMLEPTSTLIDDVNKLYDIIGNGDVHEVNNLVSDIERQGQRMTSLLNRLLQQSATKEEKGGRS